MTRTRQSPLEDVPRRADSDAPADPSLGSRIRPAPRTAPPESAGAYRFITRFDDDPPDASPPDEAPRSFPSGSYATEAPAREPDSRAMQVGDLLSGKYRLDAELRRGGMGAVWRARDVNLGLDVAVKLLRHDVLVPMGSARLLEEARSAARLRHPSVVQMLDFGETPAGDLYLVMELLLGGSLADVLAHAGSLPATEAVRILLPIASALAMAHARGIVHRDVKPDNIMFTKGEGAARVPKLIDFGVAKLSATTTRRLTIAGALIGSPDYMSPEQVFGATDVDERADVWALSMVLYEMLHGATAFGGGGGFRVLHAIAGSDPVPVTPLASHEPELWAILRRGLDKDVEKRWRSMRALGRALSRWAYDRGVTVDAAGNSLVTHWLSVL